MNKVATTQNGLLAYYCQNDPSEFVEQLTFISSPTAEEQSDNTGVSVNQASAFTTAFGLETFIPIAVIVIALTISCSLTRKHKPAFEQ